MKWTRQRCQVAFSARGGGLQPSWASETTSLTPRRPAGRAPARTPSRRSRPRKAHAQPQDSRRPSVLTATATVAATETIRQHPGWTRQLGIERLISPDYVRSHDGHGVSITLNRSGFPADYANQRLPDLFWPSIKWQAEHRLNSCSPNRVALRKCGGGTEDKRDRPCRKDAQGLRHTLGLCQVFGIDRQCSHTPPCCREDRIGDGWKHRRGRRFRFQRVVPHRCEAASSRRNCFVRRGRS